MKKARARTSRALVIFAATSALGLASCGGGPEAGPTAEDGAIAWRTLADGLAKDLGDGGDTPQTLAPDPTVSTPPDTVSELVLVPKPAATLRTKLAPLAREHSLDAPDCVDISRARALELLAEPADSQPDIPSSLCNLTRAGDPFGFVIYAALTEDTTRIWYEIGPDGASQAP